VGHGAAGAEEGSAWEGGIPSSLEEGSGEGAVPPPQKIVFYFLLKIPYFDAFWQTNGGGGSTP